MSDDIQSAYQDEVERLEKTAEHIRSHLAKLEAMPRYTGANFTEQVLESIREETRGRLSVALPEPYFGRLDFQEEGESGPVPLYIGKAGVDNDATGKPLVIDWRAPVASLFYSFSGGEDPAQYVSPDGLIEGLVYLKRNLVIRKELLQRVTDAYRRGGGMEGVSDEFLLYRLGENKDNKLRDIVSTIQAEQDKIIRAAKNKALVIQGVAGSGKTTVALHRLAYLLYQYREQVRAERMIIFAPNRMFLDYISGVLPELGVGDIAQTTFQEWALELLGGKLRLVDETKELEQRFAVVGSRKGSRGKAEADEETSAPSVPSARWKGSADLVIRLDPMLDRFEKDYLKEEDFIPWEGARLPGRAIRKWFYVENQHYPLAKRRDRVEARIKRWLEMELDGTRDPRIRKERKKAASARLKSYLGRWPEVTAVSFYRMLTEQATRPDWFPEALAADTLKLLKKQQVMQEDLALLVYLHQRLYGVTSGERFDHIVIDEAQDYAPLQVEVLKRYSRNHSFTILGDLAQGIHEDKGIGSWQEFLGLFAPEEAEMYQLTRSYRSTMEIIEFANRVLRDSGIGVEPAVPVFRSGEPVLVEAVDASSRAERIVALTRELSGAGHDTVAVIARTESEARSLHQVLSEAGLPVHLLTPQDPAYQGGLSVLPVYLSKGFEFDAVLIADADAVRYTTSPRDAKLLYVACTRALHRLCVLYTGERTKLLDE